jgi:serine/threonine protein kinase/Flp pilus assembly protein TadD
MDRRRPRHEGVASAGAEGRVKSEHSQGASGCDTLAEMPLPPGSRLGSYEISSTLGAGGMGEVYRATDTRLGREVAIKILPSALADDAERLARFEREARTVARLNHPNIVTLHSVENDNGVPFITMELVEGRDLSHVVTPGGLPIARVFDLAIPLADALVAAHELGVVHRDLKPANVMVTPDGRVKVLDFGLAKPAFAASTLDTVGTDITVSPISAVGQVLGTVPYMAPEQVRGEALDSRTDIFSFGILLYELITGRRPFLGATAADVSSAILRDAPPPLQALRPDISPDVIRIISRCLEKNRELRVQTAKDVRNELSVARQGVESGPFSARQDVPSIAVLPFVNRSRDEEDEYFADGITEDVIAQLCKVRALKVIARTSVMSLKRSEESLQQIAAQLQVAHLLEGSVRRIGDRVRIVAQLIDAASGRHLWAETYDRQLTDIFAIQTDVALHITSALKAELSPTTRGRMHREPTHDVRAYQHYLRGRHSFVRFTPVELRRSIEHFDAAIGRDPGFALAYVGLANAYSELAGVAEVNHELARSRALSAGASAIAADPDLGEAHCAYAFARLEFEFDWTGAEAGFKRALELSPNGADIYDLYGRLCAGLGRFDEAVTLHRRAHELDPLTHRVDLATTLLRAGRYEEAARAAANAITADPHDPRIYATLGWILFKQGRIDDGLAELERASTMAPTADIWLAQLGEAYALAGQTGKALTVLHQLEAPSRPVRASPYHLAYIHTGLGEVDRAMDHLERALQEGSGTIFSLKGSFLFEPLRQHPRFKALLARMGLT